MSRTKKEQAYNWGIVLRNPWKQVSLKYCTACGTRYCGGPSTVDGVKSLRKCKGTHSSKRYSKILNDEDD